MKQIIDSFRFVFRRDVTFRQPFTYESVETVNCEEVVTPINLSQKAISIRFRQRGASADMLVLNSSQPANAFGAQLTITNVAAGDWEILVPIAQIAQFPRGFGEWEMFLHEEDGEIYEITDGAFDVK